MNEILCSTGALIGRPNGRNHRLLAEFAPQLTCDGLEFMMYDTWYEKVDEIVADLQAMKLHIPVMHCEKRIGEAISLGETEEAFRLFRVNCDVARRLGAKKLVIHLWDGMTSDRYIENNYRAYEPLAKMAEENGIKLLVENVVCSHSDPMTHWKELRKRYPVAEFVFDTKMAEFHRQMDRLYETELLDLGCITHFHVNDYLGEYMDWKHLRTLPIGRGQIDFGRFFEAVKKSGYQGAFTVEATAFNAEGIVDIAMLNESFEIIREYLAEEKYNQKLRAEGGRHSKCFQWRHLRE